MSLCRLEEREKGVFVLTLGSDGSHNYLTDATITDLLENLEKIQNNAAVKGLVTTCESETGTFCDGLDYDHVSEFHVTRLAARFALVIRRLLELPIPTVAAVRGRASSFGLALVLAHDHCFVWEHALFGLPEVLGGYPLPDYVTTLLREKLARKWTVSTAQLQSCSDGKIPRRWSRHGTEGDKEVVLNKAIDLLYGIKYLDGTIVTNNRKKECPDTFAGVRAGVGASAGINAVPRATPFNPFTARVEEEAGYRTVGSRLSPAFGPQRPSPTDMYKSEW